MARSSSPAAEPRRANLTVDEMRRGINRLQRRVSDVEAFVPTSVQARFSPEVEALSTSIEATISSVFGPNTVEYNRYYHAAHLDPGGIILIGGGPDPLYRVHEDLIKGKASSLVRLREAIRFLEEEIADKEEAVPINLAQPRMNLPDRNKIFVVHGHDEAALHGVARFLEKLKLEAIILKEQPNQGLTIIEKFEASAAQVAFAVVLLTPDDLGGVKTQDLNNFRARQNVIFELGYFVGRLGRGKTCLLRKGVVEIPSDLYGVIYTELDSADGWKMHIARELKAAGLKFDANDIW